MSIRLNPYISFPADNAREGMEFYKTVFGGDLKLDTFKESGMEEHFPGEGDKIMHGMLEADNGLVLMGADTPNSMKHEVHNNISVSLSGDDEAQLTEYFEKLSAEGNVTQPLTKADWGDTFGMLQDKFGIDWMVNITEKK